MKSTPRGVPQKRCSFSNFIQLQTLKMAFWLQEFKEHLFRLLSIFIHYFVNLRFNRIKIYKARLNKLKYNQKLVIYPSITIFSFIYKRCSSYDSSQLDERSVLSQLQKYEHLFATSIFLNVFSFTCFKQCSSCVGLRLDIATTLFQFSQRK